MGFYLQDLYERMEKDLDTINFSVLSDEFHVAKVSKSTQETRSTPDFNDTSSESGSTKQAADKGSKKKKGKSNTNAKTVDNSPDNHDPVPTKSKKNQRKSKGASSSLGPDQKSSKIKEESPVIFSEEDLCQRLTELVPDFEDQGELIIVLLVFFMFGITNSNQSIWYCRR